ncbi:MAG: hypothetical protein RR942_01315 [Romboutsia sp.]
MINIKGLSKAEVLKELYNNSRPQGLGFLNFIPQDMTIEEAREILEQQTYFDYLNGRIMKIDLSSDDSFEEWLYDRDNGVGSAKRVVDKLTSTVK